MADVLRVKLPSASFSGAGSVTRMVLHTLIVNLFKYIALLLGVAVVVRARVPTSSLKSLIARLSQFL